MDKYSTLDTVVRQLLNEQQLPDQRRYGAYIGYAYSFLNGEYPVGNGGGQQLKTVPVQVGFDRTAPLPDDYIEYVSLARVVGGRMRALAHNPRLAPAGLAGSPGQPGYGALGYGPQPGAPVFTFFGWQTLGLAGWDGTCWGWGEFREEFAIDLNERTIRLSSVLAGPEGGPLLLHYHSNDLNPGQATPIHPYWQNTLKAWIAWKWYLLAKNDLNSAREHERLYGREKKLALRRTDPATLADYTDIINQNYDTVR